LTPSPRSSRHWRVRQADPCPPCPFSCRGFRASAGQDVNLTAVEPESPFWPDVEPGGYQEQGWGLARSLIQFCGVALLVLAVIAVLRFSGRTPTARPVEDSSTSSSQPASDREPRILALEVHCSGGDGRSEDLDEIGVSSWESRGDGVTWVLARLDPPAYCYLIACEPDGRFWLADPPEATVPPSRISEFRYSSDSRSSRHGSHPHGAGLRAWLLVAARDPLPPFADWPAARLLRWRSVQAEGVWRFDGRSIVRLQSGKERVLAGMSGSPRPFAQLCAFLGNIPDIDAVEAIAYPVRPESD
jgi:hypothetical protein